MPNDIEEERAVDIGRLVLLLAQHEVGDWGDSAINDPITSIVDAQRPAHELIQKLVEMDSKTLKGIYAQAGAVV